MTLFARHAAAPGVSTDTSAGLPRWKLIPFLRRGRVPLGRQPFRTVSGIGGAGPAVCPGGAPPSPSPTLQPSPHPPPSFPEFSTSSHSPDAHQQHPSCCSRAPQCHPESDTATTSRYHCHSPQCCPQPCGAAPGLVPAVCPPLGASHPCTAPILAAAWPWVAATSLPPRLAERCRLASHCSGHQPASSSSQGLTSCSPACSRVWSDPAPAAPGTPLRCWHPGLSGQVCFAFRLGRAERDEPG